MKRAAWLTTICLLLLTTMAFAQSVDGKWTTGLHARGPDGQIITLTLKSDGSKLTGTLYGIQPIPLEGTIEGNSLKIKLKAMRSGSRTSPKPAGLPYLVLPPRNLPQSALSKSLRKPA
jgi:hypothetical protein